MLSAVLALGSFAMDAAQAESGSDGGGEPWAAAVGAAFAAAFSAELALNGYAHGARAFVRDGWNALDALTVAASLTALFSSVDVSAVR